MCATHPIKGDATKVRLNFRGLKIGNKAKFEQKQPNFCCGSERNYYKNHKKIKKQRLCKAKLLRKEIGIKTGKN